MIVQPEPEQMLVDRNVAAHVQARPFGSLRLFSVAGDPTVRHRLAFPEATTMTDFYYGFWDNSIFETPNLEDFTESLTSEGSRLFGASCELTEPVASDWNQASSEVVRWAEANPHTFIAPRQPNRPVCVLAPVGRQERTSAMGAKEAIDEATRRLRVAQEQEKERRERERLPGSTRGDTLIRVGFRMHRSSPESSRLVLSVCEVYLGK
jgi:hypothetical protein